MKNGRTSSSLITVHECADLSCSVGMMPPLVRSQSSSAPPRKNTWMGTSWLMMTDILGTSVLTFAGVASKLGWFFTGFFIIVLCPVSIYSGMLMLKTRNILCTTQDVEPLTMGEAARYTMNSERAAKVVYFLVYGFAFLGNGTYLLTMGNSLQGVFYDTGLCLPSAVIWSCICCLPVVVCIRHLADSVALCFVNLLLLVAMLIIVMAKMAVDGPHEGSHTFFVAEDLTFGAVFGAMTNIIYSYTGQWLYFEIMAEMENPEEFPRVFYLNAPVQIGLYVIVAFWGYYFAGDKAEGYFLDNLPMSEAYRWASGLLFVHVAVAFLIKNVIVARHLHRSLSPERVDVRLGSHGGMRAHLEYVVCAVLVLAGDAFLANAIPFFIDFMGLLGGLLSGPISFFLPMIFYIFACIATTGDTVDASPMVTENGSCMKASLRTVFKKVPRFDLVFCLVVVCFIGITMVAGTQNVIQDIVSKSNYDPPFSCMPLKPH